MQATVAPRGNTHTFLTHAVGSGLDDHDRHVVEAFRSLANGGIVSVRADEPGRKGRRRARWTDRHAKGGREDAPGPRQDHHRDGVQRRGSGVHINGVGAQLTYSRIAGRKAEPRALPDVRPARRRPDACHLDTTTGMDQPMACHDPETGRARDSERSRKRTAGQLP